MKIVILSAAATIKPRKLCIHHVVNTTCLHYFMVHDICSHDHFGMRYTWCKHFGMRYTQCKHFGMRYTQYKHFGKRYTQCKHFGMRYTQCKQHQNVNKQNHHLMTFFEQSQHKYFIYCSFLRTCFVPHGNLVY